MLVWRTRNKWNLQRFLFPLRVNSPPPLSFPCYHTNKDYTTLNSKHLGWGEERKTNRSVVVISAHTCGGFFSVSPYPSFICFFSSFHQVVQYLMQCHYIAEIAAVLQFSKCHPAKYVSLQQFAFIILSGVLKISSSIHVQIWKIASHRDELNQLVIPIKINVFLERVDIWGINQNLGILSFL